MQSPLSLIVKQGLGGPSYWSVTSRGHHYATKFNKIYIFWFFFGIIAGILTGYISNFYESLSLVLLIFLILVVVSSESPKNACCPYSFRW